MSPNDTREDTVLAALRTLPPCDVSPGHAERLRARCRARLEGPDPLTSPPAARELGPWQLAAGVFAAAWCVVYVLETLRRAAAVYGL